MNEDKSFVTREDIEGRLADLKTETDGIGGPSIISRRILAACSAVLILLVVFYVGKRRGERTKTFVEVIRSE